MKLLQSHWLAPKLFRMPIENWRQNLRKNYTFSKTDDIFLNSKNKNTKLYKLHKGNDASILWNPLPGNTVSQLYPITCLWSSCIHKCIDFPTTFSFKDHFPYLSVSIPMNWRHQLINYMSLWLWSWKSKPQDTSPSKTDYPKKSYRFEKVFNSLISIHD